MEDSNDDGSSDTSIKPLGGNVPGDAHRNNLDEKTSPLYGLNVCFDILIHTSDWGHEVKWKINGPKTNTSCESNREYNNNYTYTQRCCLPTRETDLNLTCIDTFGDGWHGANLEIDGKHYCQNFKGGHMTVVAQNPAKKECIEKGKKKNKNTKIYLSLVILFWSLYLAFHFSL